MLYDLIEILDHQRLARTDEVHGRGEGEPLRDLAEHTNGHVAGLFLKVFEGPGHLLRMRWAHLAGEIAAAGGNDRDRDGLMRRPLRAWRKTMHQEIGAL